jgi:hypothetical protein
MVEVDGIMSKGLCDYNLDKTSRWPTEGMYFNIVKLCGTW